MIMMWVTSFVTASKERQTGAKSCKAGKLHNADKRALLADLRPSHHALAREPDGISLR
jgi:hypothetical protein